MNICWVGWGRPIFVLVMEFAIHRVLHIVGEIWQGTAGLSIVDLSGYKSGRGNL